MPSKSAQAQEILDRMKVFYLQTDGTYAWPNSREGDLLEMIYKLLNKADG